MHVYSEEYFPEETERFLEIAIKDNLEKVKTKITEADIEVAEIMMEKGVAFEKFLIGIKQYPDNIPMLKAIIEAYEALRNEKKAGYYKDYITEVVKRIWGEEYLSMINLDKSIK